MLGLVLGLIANAVVLATPMVTKWVLDTVGDGGSLTRPLAVLLGLVIVGALMSLWQWVLLGSLAERVVLDARTSMARRYFAATIGAITRRPPGELVTRVTSDAALLHKASSSIVGIVNSVLAMLATLVLMGVLDMVLLVFTLGSVVVVAVLMGGLMPAIASAQESAQESVGLLGGRLEGSLRAIRTVKASRAENRQTKRVVEDARDTAAHGIRVARRSAAVWTISWTGIQLAIIVILGVGAWRTGQGLLEVSSLIAFLLYAFQLVGPITDLTQNVTALQAGVAAAARIQQVDSIPAEADAVPVARTEPADPTGPVLALRGVTARYGPDQPDVVVDVDLEIPRRGHTAIVGPSGAGKTTLFSLILRFLEPTSGTLILDGHPYRAYSHDEIRRRLAYVEQETPLLPGTIRNNLLFTHPDATEAEMWAALNAVHLDELVDALDDGLDTSLSGSSISGGQRQRLALARSILRAPDVLLLDEATAQVDGLTEAALHEVIRCRAAESAVVTIAHRLSTVLDANTIVVMENGRVRARGTHADLMENDSLYQGLVEALRIAEGAPAPA